MLFRVSGAALGFLAMSRGNGIRAGQRGAAGLEVPLGRVAAPLLSLARARLLTTLCLALGGLAGGAAAGAGSGVSAHAAAEAVAKVA